MKISFFTYRKLAKLTLAETASALDCSLTHLFNLEKGLVKPTKDEEKKMEAILKPLVERL